MKKSSNIYVIEYRYYNKDLDTWVSHISQECYSNYEDARKFCVSKVKNEGITATPFYFQGVTDGIAEEFYIHELILK